MTKPSNNDQRKFSTELPWDASDPVQKELIQRLTMRIQELHHADPQAALMSQIVGELGTLNLDLHDAAKRLNISENQVSALLNADAKKFSLGDLLTYAIRLGWHVELNVRKEADTIYIPEDELKDEASTLFKATLRASERLGLTRVQLLNAIAIDELQIKKIFADRTLDPQTSSGQRGIQLVRIYNSLQYQIGQSSPVTMWMNSYNTALTGTPMDLIQSPEGLDSVLRYLER